MNEIFWPEDYIPGFTDNFASNEVIVAGLSASDVWPFLSKAPLWPRIRELSEHFRAKGISLLDAPVSGSRPQAESAQLVYLIGGDAKALSAAEPLLTVLGSSIQHVGPIGAGSLAKLTTNTLLGVQVDTIAELIRMVQRQGVDPKQILDAVASTPVWSTVAGRIAASMLSGTFAPQFPIELIEKDFSYTVHTAGGEENAPAITAIRNIFRKAISEGLGELNMTAIVKLFEGHKDRTADYCRPL